MCLAIFQPAGKQIPENHLFEGFKNNPHGAGFMYFDESAKLCIYRSMDYESFINEYEKQWALHGQNSPFSIHFRWATHGTTNIDNVHPFQLNEHVGVLHNGIIDCIIKDSRMSDTAAFVRDYLGSLPRNWYDNEFLFNMVEDFTSGSKLVVMTSDPGSQYYAYIVNERLGHWADDVWYSNSSYSCAKPRGFSAWKSAFDSASVFEDEDDTFYDILSCELCGEESVLDDICYTCESCQRCFMTEADCACSDVDVKQLAFHDMTDAQFKKHYQL